MEVMEEKVEEDEVEGDVKEGVEEGEGGQQWRGCESYEYRRDDRACNLRSWTRL